MAADRSPFGEHAQCRPHPHIGGATWNTEARQARMVADDLGALLSGNRPAHVVNPEVLGS